MLRVFSVTFLFILLCLSVFPQSGRQKGYSESISRGERIDAPVREIDPKSKINNSVGNSDSDIIRVETDLVTIPVRVTTKRGQPVPDVKQGEFKIFENGIEQEIAYFSTQDEPFTVALMLDMSYSSVFKLAEIQDAALAFVNQLRKDDKVMIVSFDEKVRVLCMPTDNRKALRYAIEGAKIASGTSLYTAFDKVLNENFRNVPGRKAIVILTDGVDTTSVTKKATDVIRDIDELDTLIYPIQYDTFDDVRKSRRNDAQILYDDDDKPYIVESPLVKGEKEGDYEEAREFLQDLASQTGGRVQRVNSKTNLNSAFARIADELRKTYSLGYYPSSEKTPGQKYSIRVRVYRPDLDIRARDNYSSARKRL